ncbi:MAG: cobalamin-binding protein [Candidatus Acidiferrales bacterium]
MDNLRIVSLIASATEIVCAMGYRAQLVGRSHECDFPPSVNELPVCTEPKLRIDVSSREIDEQVKRILTEALSVYRVDAERLRALRPDVVVTQSHCEVCAVSLRDVERALCDWIESRPQIVSLEPDSLDDVWRDIRRVATAFGAPARGEELVAELQQRMSAVQATAAKFPQRLTVACIEWIDPLMAAGNWMPELVEMAGGVNLFGVAGKHSPWMTWEELRAKDPDVIVVLPCGFDIARSRQEMPALTQRPDWRELRALCNSRVYIADGNQYFNRPGPRLADSLEILAEILHPSAFSFGHKGAGWQLL